MLLKEFAIRRYGPLPDSGKRVLGAFNLFYGPNEEGKTLTIDAILKMLFGKSAARYFEEIKRVEENPEGYLVIEENGSKETVLPAGGSINELFGYSIAEFSNIFIIRDSDLTINDEGDFYRGITGRLTGMRSEEISNIKDSLCDLGRITAGGEYQNSAPYKLKDQIRKVQALLAKVEPLSTRLLEEGFSNFEEKLASLEAEQSETVNKLSDLRAAANRDRYSKGREILKRLREALASLDSLKTYKRADYEAWQRAALNLEHLEDDHRRLKRENVEKLAALAVARNAKKEKESACKAANNRQNTIREIIEPLLAAHDTEETLTLKSEILINNPYFNKLFFLVGLILLISLAGAVLRPSWWQFIFLPLSALLTLLAGWFRYNLLVRQSRLAVTRAKIFREAEKLGLPGDDLAKLRAALGQIKLEVELHSEMLSEAEKEVEWQQKELDRLSFELRDKLQRVSAVKEQIGEIKLTLQLDALSAFEALLKRKDLLENEINRQVSILESHFEGKGNLLSLERQIDLWAGQVEELSSYAPAAPGVQFDQSTLNKLNVNRQNIEAEIKILQGKMKDSTEELRDIEKEVNELLHLDKEGHLPCQTTLDLEMIGKRLINWLDCLEADRKTALLSLEIFSEMEEAEEQKVTALFGQNSPVSNYFSTITDGRYKEVYFESRDNPIKTVRADGATLNAANLSGGAFDQLYFAIRLALAEKLLEGKKGFFILDDPFIKADPVRLNALVNMLFEICAAGWQILYFSSKGEIKDALKQKITAGEILEFSISITPATSEVN
jgi:DNA repair protein SbcC/Rad50